jgi:hypothetical protein
MESLKDPETCTVDCHVLIVNKDTNYLYELFKVSRYPNGTWRARTGTVYDLLGYALWPEMWGSADVAGLAMLP